MYKYKGVEYPTLQTLAIIVNIEYKTLHGIYNRALKTDKTFSDYLEEYILWKDMIEKACKLYNELFKENTKTVSEIKGSLKSKGFTTNFVEVYKADLLNKVKLVGYATQGDYEWLLKAGKNFTYRGMYFASIKAFLDYYKIILYTLFDNIIKHKGDLKKAILVCENDPEYRKSGMITIKGIKYNSVKAASDLLGFNPIYYRTKLREGYTPDEAYDMAMATTRVEFRLDDKLPITIGGELIETADHFLNLVNINRQYLIKEIKNGKTLEEIYKEYSVEKEPIINYKGYKFYTIKDIATFLGVDAKNITRLKQQLGELEDVIDKYDNDKMMYNNKIYFSPTQLAKDLGVSVRQVVNTWTKALQKETKKEQEAELKKLLEYNKKLTTYLHYKGTEFTTTSEMYKALGVGKSTLQKYIEESETYDVFEEKLESLIRSKQDSEIYYDGKYYSSLWVLYKETGIAWIILDKYRDESETKQEFTDKVKTHLKRRENRKIRGN